MVFHRKVVQLEHQHAVRYQPLIVRPAMGALAPEQLLIPSATRLYVVDRNQGLWSHELLLVLLLCNTKYSTHVQRRISVTGCGRGELTQEAGM
jgi:hypothetical protein